MRIVNVSWHSVVIKIFFMFAIDRFTIALTETIRLRGRCSSQSSNNDRTVAVRTLGTELKCCVLTYFSVLCDLFLRSALCSTDTVLYGNLAVAGWTSAKSFY